MINNLKLKSIFNNRLLLLVLALVLGLRVFIFFSVVVPDPKRAHANDSRSYNDCALAIAETGKFYKGTHPDSPPEVFRTPGYPIFLALFYKIWGFDYIPVVFVQVFIGGLFIPVLLFLILKNLTSPNIACLGALFVGLDLNTLILEMSVLSETLAHLSVTLIIFFCYRLLIKELFWSSVIAISMLLVLSTFIRPITYYLPICLCIGILCFYKLYKYKSQQVFAIILFIFILPITVFRVWEFRNEKLTGMDLFSSVSAVNMLHYRAAGIHAIKAGISFEKARGEMDSLMYQDRLIKSDNLHERRMEFGKKFITENFLIYARVAFQSLPKLLLGPGVTQVMIFLGEHERWQIIADEKMITILKNWMDRSPLFVAVLGYSIFYILILNLLAFIGVIRIFFLNQRYFVFNLCLLGIFLYFIFISAGPEAYARFRAPFSIIYYYFSVLGLIGIANCFKHYK